jgi:hypothetical protein
VLSPCGRWANEAIGAHIPSSQAQWAPWN